MTSHIANNIYRTIKQSALFAFVFIIGSCSLVKEQDNALTHRAEMNTAINIQDQLTVASYLNEKSIRQSQRANNAQSIMGEEGLLTSTQPTLEASFGAPRLKRTEGQNIVYHYGSNLCQLDIYFTDVKSNDAIPAFFTMRQAQDFLEDNKREVALSDCLISLHKDFQTAQK